MACCTTKLQFPVGGVTSKQCSGQHNRQDSGHQTARTRPSLPTVNENRLLRVFYPILDQYSTMDSADTGRTSDSCLAMSFHLREPFSAT